MRRQLKKKHVIGIPGLKCEVQLKPKSAAKLSNRRNNIIGCSSAVKMTPSKAKPLSSPRMAQAASGAGSQWIYLDPPGIWISLL